jgi:cold shock CspA family protein
MKPTVSIREALTDPRLLGNVLAGDSWHAWRVLLIAAMGEELTEAERATFTALTGREREPLQWRRQCVFAERQDTRKRRFLFAADSPRHEIAGPHGTRYAATSLAEKRRGLCGFHPAMAIPVRVEVATHSHQQEKNMPTGVVKTFKDKWGFIRPSGGGVDLFFHQTDCLTVPSQGGEVEYREAPDRKHPGRSCAVDVRPIEREVAA